jgi:hypothetical protein
MRGKPQRTAAAGGAHGGDSLLQTTEVQVFHPLQVAFGIQEKTMGFREQPYITFPIRQDSADHLTLPLCMKEGVSLTECV